MLSGRLYGESLGMAIAARLIGIYGARRPTIKAGSLSQSQVERVVNYMRVNLAQDVPVLGLMGLARMSESHATLHILRPFERG